MDVAAAINCLVATIVIGGCVWAILALFWLALVSAGAIEDEALEELAREEVERTIARRP